MEWLGLVAILLSAVATGYGIYQNQQSLDTIKANNKLQQSNFENQYQVTSSDMSKAGFNPMAMFNGGSLNNYVQGQSYTPGESPFSSLLDSLQNSQINKMRRTEIENQKDVQDANIGLIKAQTIAQLLDNKKVQSLLDGPDGNVYLKKILSEVGLDIGQTKLSESQASYYDDYWVKSQKLQDSINSTNKEIARMNNQAQKEIQSNAQKFEKELSKIKALQSVEDKKLDNFLAINLARIQHVFKAKESVISGIFSSWTTLSYGTAAHPLDMDKMMESALNSCSQNDFESKADYDSFRNAIIQMFDKLK